MDFKRFALILICLLAGFMPVLEAKANKAQAAAFKGHWKGDAVYTVGKSKGQKAGLDLKFGTGNFDHVSGIAFLNLEPKGRVSKFSRTTRKATFMVLGNAGGKKYNIDFVSEFNYGFSGMSGTFRTRMGSGTFSMKKLECSPASKQLKGEWKGKSTWTKGKFVKKTPEGELKLVLPEGRFDTSGEKCFDAGRFTLERIEASAWDPQKRSVSFVLVVKMKKGKTEMPFTFSGVFNENYTELSGTFEAPRFGKGTFKITRPLPVEKPKKRKHI